MTKRDLIIWAAGFIDGEGCIAINRQWSQPKGRKYTNFVLQISVCQKVRTPLDRLQEMWGGHVYQYNLGKAKYWRWLLWSHNAAAAVEQMLPYLTVKRPIAEVALRFEESMLSTGGSRQALPEPVAEMRRILFEEAKRLNRRGQHDGSAAETKSSDPFRGCDSPACIDDKDAEVGGNDQPLVN